MPLVQRTVTVVHRQGLHARPAAVFVQLANRFTSKITVKRGRKIVDGKSVLGLLTLAAKHGARISIVIDGIDAHEALAQLARVVTEPLSEPAEARPHARS